MQGHWPDFRAAYVEPLLRSMDRGEMGPCEFVLLVFSTPDCYSTSQVESSGWISSISEFRALLDGLQFVGGGLGEVAVAAAFAELTYLQSLPSQLPGIPDPARPPPCHCLLIAASDPHRLPVMLPYRNTSNRFKCPNMHDYRDIPTTWSDTHNIDLSIATLKERSLYPWVFLSHCNKSQQSLVTSAEERAAENSTLVQANLTAVGGKTLNPQTLNTKP